jgi:cyclopropane-fatty-acyl-phospholipid synthase
MTYSSALFLAEDESHEQAQANKYQRILDELNCVGGESILEVGCGWGGFMEAAVNKGCQVKGLTLSTEQQKYAQHRLENNLADKTTSHPSEKPVAFDVALQDYRHEAQTYDHIVSIEMFEAVGKEYWQSYFKMLKNALNTQGKAVVQVITIDEIHAETYQNKVDFIQTYIFPGGLLPSVSQFEAMAREAGLEVGNVFEFGQDYAKTCQIWKSDFNRQSEKLEGMGYDKAFQRLWNYYLDYCTVGFETGHSSVHQFTLKHA